MSNFLIGGRLGDAVHALYVAKNTPGKHNIFITDRRDLHSDGFLYSLEQTYEELKPIITAQDWCNSFQVLEDEVVDIEQNNSVYIPTLGCAIELINLSMWRRYAYSASWTQLLSNTFNVPVNGEPWIKMPVPKNPRWSEWIVIHSSIYEARKGHHWEIVMSNYNGHCVFVGSPEEYKAFKYSTAFYEPINLYDHFDVINSCKFFIGNQSAPLAIAHSLGVPRLAMLNEVDKIHYVGEEKFCKNYYWMAKDTHFYEGLNY